MFSITYCKRIWSTFCFNRDGGTWYPPQVCKFLKVEHHIHSPFEKSIIERIVQYIKDRTTESFNDYIPCKKDKCKLNHIKNWLNLFVDYHNKEINVLG